MATKPRPRKMKLDHIEECFVRMSARLPEPKTELEYKNPYTLLVAVVLSAQATDVGVNRATKGLYAAADTPQAMVALGVDGPCPLDQPRPWRACARGDVRRHGLGHYPVQRICHCGRPRRVVRRFSPMRLAQGDDGPQPRSARVGCPDGAAVCGECQPDTVVGPHLDLPDLLLPPSAV